MSTEADDRIAILYPDESPPPGDEQPADASLLGESEQPPGEPSHARETGNPYSITQDREDTLYGATDAVSLPEDADLSAITSDPDEQATLRTNLGYIAAEAGATQSDLQSMVEHTNRLMLTGERHDPDAAMTILYDQHGPDLPRKLNDAQALVNSFPDLADWLEQTGAGDDPTLINQVIRLAQSNRAQARLQKWRSKK